MEQASDVLHKSPCTNIHKPSSSRKLQKKYCFLFQEYLNNCAYSKMGFYWHLFTCSCTTIILVLCKFVACIFIFSTYSAPLHEALRASDPALKLIRQVIWQRMWRKLNYWLMDIFLVMQLSSYGQWNGMQKSIWPSFSVFRLQCYIVSIYFNIRLNCRRFSKLGHVLQLLICLVQSRLVEFMHVYQTPEVYSILECMLRKKYNNNNSDKNTGFPALHA